MRRRRDMEHAMPLPGPSSHNIEPLASLHQHYFGRAWLAALAVCRRPAAYSSVGHLGKESEKRGTSGVGPCSLLRGRAIYLDEVNVGDHVSLATCLIR